MSLRETLFGTTHSYTGYIGEPPFDGPLHQATLNEKEQKRVDEWCNNNRGCEMDAIHALFPEKLTKVE